MLGSMDEAGSDAVDPDLESLEVRLGSTPHPAAAARLATELVAARHADAADALAEIALIMGVVYELD
jgi:hypothetical protein